MSKRLFVNIGNTAVHWAEEVDGQWSADGRIAWRDGDMLADTGIDRPEVIVACVSNPSRLPHFEASAPGPVQVVGRDFTGGIPVGYRDPGQLGADRLATATAAAHLHGIPCVVVSAGTCLTCEAISADGVLVGGAIAPGLPAYLQGLAAAVPHLPEPELQPGAEVALPGKTTEQNLVLGLYLSLAGAADRLATAVREAVGRDATLVLTGGDAGIVERFSLLQWRSDPLLDLEGLRIIYDAS
jgi:type III pantothenate kinase